MSDLTFKGQQGDYTILSKLGDSGLYGQAYLCYHTDNQERVVVKVLQPNAPKDGLEVLEREAVTLERVAQAEVASGYHYAVRLLDRGYSEGTLHFIVMEQATGANVRDDLLEKAPDGLDEALILSIASHFSKALKCVHQAGLTYDDMKIENLFWKETDPHPLRIIDWNVVREIEGRPNAIAGDWARFGARLYELYTNQAIAIDRDGMMLGAGPTGSRWDELPDGVRIVINQALTLGYANDDLLLSALEAERDLQDLESASNWRELIRRAEQAEQDSQIEAVAIFAPIARAERYLRLHPETPEAAQWLQRCAELRQQATIRQGQATASSLEEGFRLFAKDDFPTAKRIFEQAYNETRQQDPCPRRGIWLAQLVLNNPELDAEARRNMVQVVRDLNAERSDLAKPRLETWSTLSRIDHYRWLLDEAAARAVEATGQLAEASRLASAQATQLGELWPDLRTYADALARRTKTEDQRQEAEARDKQLSVQADQALEQARHDEVYAPQQALVSYRRALQALRQLSQPDQTRLDWVKARLGQLQQQVALEQLQKDAANVGDSPESLAWLSERAQANLPELTSVFAALIRLGEQQAAHQQAPITEVVANLQTKLDEISQTLDALSNGLTDQRSAMNLNAEITEIRRLIGEGVLNAAETQIEGVKQRNSSVSDVLSNSLTELERQLKDQRTIAKARIKECRTSLYAQCWKDAADEFGAAIRLENDQLAHYEVLKDACTSVTTCLNTALRTRLKDVVYPNNPLLTMFSSLIAEIGVVGDKPLLSETIRDLTRKYQDRLKKLGIFLYHLSIDESQQLLITDFKNLDTEDQRSLEPFRRALLPLQPGVNRG